MTDTEKEQMRHWLDNWKRASETLEELRVKEIRESDISESILAFDTAFKAAIWHSPPSSTSGLVEFQKKLLRLKK
jgi:hypothetical protein